MDSKITGLTHFNISALREVFTSNYEDGSLVLTETTATFVDCPPQEAVKALDSAMTRLPTRGHPRHSLHAVRRKLVRLA